MARLKRRVLLKTAGGVTAASILLPGCLPQRTWSQPAHQPEGQVPGQAYWYATLCGECPSGCGLIVRNLDGRVRKVEGNPIHPVSRGKTCARGQASVQRTYNPDRIQAPLALSGARASGTYQTITWDDAIGRLTDRLRGAGANVQFLTRGLRGHLRFLVERFQAGLGAPAPIVFDLYQTVEGRDALRTANQQAFARAEIPDYDLDNADFVMSFGADLFGTWLSPVRYNAGYGALRQGRPNQRGYLVAFEPRMTQTGACADEWVPIRPGTEGVVALALAGLAGKGGGLPAVTPEDAAAQAGIPDVPGGERGVDRLRRLGQQLAAARAPLAIGGGVAAGQTNGTWNLWAINAVNGALGAVGRAGGVRFGPPSPLTDVPAAAPAGPLSALQGLVSALNGGGVQVLIVYDANPVYEAPASLGVPVALDKAAFIVSFSSFMDETTQRADLILPDHSDLERWGDDVPEPSVGFAAASLRQPTVEPFLSTQAVGDTLLQVVQRLGNGGLSGQLPFASFVDLLKNRWGALQTASRGSVRGANFDEFWDQALRQGGWWDQGTTGPAVAGAGTAPPAPEPAQYDGAEPQYPYHFVPFLSPAWSDGRGANIPWLQEMPDPMSTACWGTWAELNPETARRLGVKDNDIVEVASPYGAVRAPVVISPGIRPDTIAMPFGQGHNSPAFRTLANQRGVNPAAILSVQTDSRSGQLAWASTRVSVRSTGEAGRIVRYIRNLDGARQLPGYQLVKTMPLPGGRT